MGIGVVAAFSYNRIMVNGSQGTMRRLRNELFSKMESLPIKYFDTHAHGDIMSVYTNDVDTLRQLLSQSIPQIINSVITKMCIRDRLSADKGGTLSQKAVPGPHRPGNNSRRGVYWMDGRPSIT